MNKYKWILIDLDNTLFDFDQCERRALYQFFSEVAGEHKDQYINVFHQINQRVWAEVEQGVMSVDDVNSKRVGKTLDALNLTYNRVEAGKIYVNALSEAVYLFEGARELLSSLESKYQVAAITNGFYDVKMRHLKKTGLEFEHLFISQSLGVSKPSPQFFDMVLEAIKADKKDCLIFGDGLKSDVLGGINSGIDTCWYNPKELDSETIQPTYTVVNYQQLKELLELS